MESTVKTRLQDFIAALGISERQFCISIDVSPAYVSTISKSIQPDKLSRISEQYPQLDLGWLLTGRGEMLRSDVSIGNGASGVVGNTLNNSTINNDQRHYYSDSPDVLRAQIDLLDERIKEKDAQIKEKDAQIKEKDAQIKQLLDIIQGMKK